MKGRLCPYITLAKKDKPNFSIEKDWLGYVDVVDPTTFFIFNSRSNSFKSRILT